jgi:hypothetical protein
MALGGVPGMMEVGLDGLDGQGMGGLGAMGRGDEDERKRRLGMVVDILKTNKGRLSEAGIERLARRVGLESLWEDGMGSASAGSMRTLIIAGSALALDIEFSNNVVKKVSLSFPEASDTVTKHTAKAEDILLRDLEFAPNESPLTKMLDRFAGNLERLAALDKLSVIPGLNCHEAIAGIYESLQKLHKWEVARLKEQDDMAGKEEAYIERAAECTKSGKPLMHTRDRLGLSLDYWQEKRRISDRKEEKTWSLLVECAPLQNPLLRSLRVSENWISPEIQKAEPAAEDLFLIVENAPVLDWLEPDATLLPNQDPPKLDAMEGIDQASAQKYPEVMFIAKFDPPIIVPYGLAMQICNSTSAQLDMYQTTTFDGLMFPQGPHDKVEPGETRIIKQRVEVPIFADGEKTTRTHKNTLFIEKLDYGRTLTELPFSHPRQLVEILPSLRQYAFLSTLLQKSFKCQSNPAPEVKKGTTKNKKEKFAEFMAGISTDELSIDISFTTQPLPRIYLVFPFKKRTANVTFDIKLNGAVEVVSQNVIDPDVMEDGRALSVADLGKMLEITEDLGIWTEFVKKRLG